MKILLCAATEMEIAPVIQLVARHQNLSVEVVITGVGLMTSTYAITKSIAQHQPTLIIQAGIAGALDNSLSLGEVVAVKSETVGDLGVQEGAAFQSLFDLKLLSSSMLPWHNGRLLNESDLLRNIGLRIVDGVTINEISTNDQRINYYRQNLQAQIETMEGAALHYVALMEKLPFIQLRSLSNFVGERDKTKWELKQAINNLNTELQQLLTKEFIQ